MPSKSEELGIPAGLIVKMSVEVLAETIRSTKITYDLQNLKSYGKDKSRVCALCGELHNGADPRGGMSGAHECTEYREYSGMEFIGILERAGVLSNYLAAELAGKLHGFVWSPEMAALGQEIYELLETNSAWKPTGNKKHSKRSNSKKGR